MAFSLRAGSPRTTRPRGGRPVVIYLDTLALAKLIVQDGDGRLGPVAAAADGTPVVTSIIGRVEVMRVARRFTAATNGAHLLLTGLDTIPLTKVCADVAQTTGSATLRTLDAIHLANALSIYDEPTAFCRYDRRLREAVGDAGLPGPTPGG